MSATVYEEDVLDNIKTYFTNNLDTYLTAIETLKADGVNLQDMKRYEIGDKDVYGLQQYPAGLIFPGEAVYEEYSLSADLLRFQIMLTMAIKSGKTENLTTMVLRYASAVRQCIDADRTAGDTVDRMRIDQINFYARTPGQDQIMVIECVITAEKEIPR